MSDVEATDSAKLRLPPEVAERLVCPRNGQRLQLQGDHLVCTDPGCGLSFPVVDGVPILIDESRSVFDIADFLVKKPTTLDLRERAERCPTLRSRLKDRVIASLPSLSYNVSDFKTRDAVAAIEAAVENPRILVVGAGDERLETKPGTVVVYSDVTLGSDLVMTIADAHDLPFEDATFDGYIAVAVVEYLPDPARAMAEAHRVLGPGGFAYVVAPMMQQNTLGEYDFFLFTHSGLRRLMHNFTEVRSGVANGPGMALCWSILYCLMSLSERRLTRNILSVTVRLLFWPIKYLDKRIKRLRGAYDCASAFYFFGRRSEVPVSDREIMDGYRGLRGRREAFAKAPS